MNPENLSNDSIRDIALLIREQIEAKEVAVGGKPYVILRSDQKVQEIESLLPKPTRKTGTVVFRRSESFVRYVNQHKLTETRIYVIDAGFILAVINEHGNDAGWRDYRAQYTLVNSLEWKAWNGQNKTKMTQKDFCEFIEDNSKDITDRTNMIELVRTLQVNTSVDYKGFEKGDGGNMALQFVRTTAAKAGQLGEVELPERFKINIPMFEGGEMKEIDVKLRFDIGDGKLKLWYELQQIPRITNAHVDAVVAAIEKATGITPYFGNP